jgi:putative heme transporter
VILGRAIDLHPLVIILAITAGSLPLGILGTFLAVPVAATVAGVIEDVRGRTTDDDTAAQTDAGPPEAPTDRTPATIAPGG